MNPKTAQSGKSAIESATAVVTETETETGIETGTMIGIVIMIVVVAIAGTARYAAAAARQMITRRQPHEVRLGVTRVGGEAEAEMMTAVTHAVTEMATIIVAVAEAAHARGPVPVPALVPVPAPVPARPVVTIGRVIDVTTEIAATAIVTVTATIVIQEIIAAGGMMAGELHPSVRPLHNLLKMNEIAALSLSSSSPPAFELES